MSYQFFEIDTPSQIQDPKFLFGRLLQAALTNPLFFAIDPEYIVNELASVLELCKQVGFKPSETHHSAQSQILRHALTNPDFVASFVDLSSELDPDGGEAKGLQSILNAMKFAA